MATSKLAAAPTEFAVRSQENLPRHVICAPGKGDERRICWRSNCGNGTSNCGQNFPPGNSHTHIPLHKTTGTRTPEG